MSTHWFSFRQGDRSEYLAQYMLSSLGLAVKVPREEDVGIDFHCTLARMYGQRISYFAPFNVQVKSSTVSSISYGGIDNKGNWKEDSVRWLLNQRTPFFIAIVDKNTGKLDLFSTATRWFAVHGALIPCQITLKPYTPGIGEHIGNGTKSPIEVTPQNGMEPISWELPLGQPILSMNFDDAENQSFLLTNREQLKDYIYLDANNAVKCDSGLLHFQWPLVIKTNDTLMQYGISFAWPSEETQKTHQQLRALTPLIATLSKTFQQAREPEKARRLASLIDMLPDDPDLSLAKDMINKILEETKTSHL